MLFCFKKKPTTKKTTSKSYKTPAWREDTVSLASLKTYIKKQHQNRMIDERDYTYKIYRRKGGKLTINQITKS